MTMTETDTTRQGRYTHSGRMGVLAMYLDPQEVPRAWGLAPTKERAEQVAADQLDVYLAETISGHRIRADYTLRTTVMTTHAPTIPDWISELARLADGWSPEIVVPEREYDAFDAYLSIPLGPTTTALEIEQGNTVVNGSVKGQVLTLHLTIRTWDRTGALSDEQEIGEFTPEQARFILPIVLAGIAALAQSEVEADDQAERRMAEDDAAWNTGGYVG